MARSSPLPKESLNSVPPECSRLKPLFSSMLRSRPDLSSYCGHRHDHNHGRLKSLKHLRKTKEENQRTTRSHLSNLKWLSRQRVALYLTLYLLSLVCSSSGAADGDEDTLTTTTTHTKDVITSPSPEENGDDDEINAISGGRDVDSLAGSNLSLPCPIVKIVHSPKYSTTWIVEWEKSERNGKADKVEQLYIAIWKDDSQQWMPLVHNLETSGRRKINKSDLELTLLDPNVDDTGLYTCKSKFPLDRLTDNTKIGPLSFAYNVTIQDRPNRLGRPEVREKSSRTVKLRRNGQLVPNFSAIQRLVVEVEAPENVTYEIPFNNMAAVIAEEPFLLTKLRPFTQYRFRIAAENKIGRGPWSDWSYSINTDEEAPEGKPQQLKTEKMNETSLLVTWRAPQEETLNGELKEFEIRWRKGKEDPSSGSCVEAASGGVERNTTVKASVSKQKYSYWIPGLQVFTCYSIRLRARNSKGLGPAALTVGKTDESTPPAPSYVRATEPSVNGFVLLWKVKKEDLPGILTKFLLQYRASSVDKNHRHDVDSPLAAVQRTRTLTDDAEKDDDGVGAPWLEEWHYCLEMDEINYCINKESWTFPIKGLQPNTRYEYRVAGYTSKGRGEFSTVLTVMTEPPTPSQPRKLVATQEEIEGKPAIRVKWHLPMNDTVDKYEVKFIDYVGETGNRLLHLVFSCADGLSMPDREKCLGKDAVVKQVEPADAFNLSKVDYNYNASSGFNVVFLNWTDPVEFKTEVRAGNQKNNHQGFHFGKSAISEVIKIGEPAPPRQRNEPEIGKIVAIVVCAIVVLFVVSAIAFAFTRSTLPPCLGFLNRKYSGTEYFDASDGQMASINEVASAIDCNIYQETDSPIPVSDFAAYVHRGHANDNLGFAEDFEEILATCRSPPPAKNSEDPQNQVKNRYLNIVAYDNTRVKLKPLNGSGGKGGDYINANYIDGYQKAKAYIASQGPIPSTFEDFWQMVWENNTHVIIMVTNLIERGRLKCDQYWPLEGTQTYGNYEVHLAETAALAHYTVRNFHLRHRSHKGSKHKHRHERHLERLVRQFHFTEWPDHGTPNHTLPILSFIRKSSASNPEGAGPMVVHCSAGVGRTGTYIVIDTMLKQIRDKETINIKGFLKYIRQQRNHLVQTEDQYVFTHDVLLEAIHSDLTEVGVGSIGAYVEDLQSILLGPAAPGAEVTRLEHQMDLVTSYIPDEYDLLNALKPVNGAKCRARALAPVEHARVTLAPKPGVEGSDFINASFLHSYKRDATFIVTQHPLQTTIQDFWRLIWDYNVKTVVLLGAFEASNEFPTFWPDSEEETIKCDQFKVAFREREEVSFSQNGPSIGVGMDFILQANQDDYELCTRIFYFPGWSRGIVGTGAYSSNPPTASTATNGGGVSTTTTNGGDVSSAPATTTSSTSTYSLDAVFEYVDQVSLWHVDHPSNFVVVVDPLGGTDAASFCALSTLQEQIRAEQTVDIYQVAALYHFKRPGIWTNIADYHFLYLAIKSVAHQFEAPKRSQCLALNKNASSLSAGYDYLRHSPRLLRSASSRLGASFRGANAQRAASSPRDSPTLPVRAISGFAGQDFSIGAPSDSTPKTSHTSLARESPMTPPQCNNVGPTSNYGCDQNSNNSSKVGTPQSHHSSNGFIESIAFKPTANHPTHLLNGQTPSPLSSVAAIIVPPTNNNPQAQPLDPLLSSSHRNVDHRSNERLLTSNHHRHNDNDVDDPFTANDRRLDGTETYYRPSGPSSHSSSEKVYHETEM